jgi:hypothetical protein
LDVDGGAVVRALRKLIPRLRISAVVTGVGLSGALIALAIPLAVADTYKWVDPQGQVHYSDSPPVGVQYEVIAAPRAQASAPPAAGTPSATPTPATAVPATPVPPPPVVDESAKDRACVDALYQVTLLNQRQPVFKQAADGSRRYIEDAERPAEIARLHAVRDLNCSDDPATQRSQAQRASQLMIAMSPRCAEARDELANYEDPATHTPADQIARQRAFVERNCSGGERIDLWRGDWIRVGR